LLTIALLLTLCALLVAPAFLLFSGLQSQPLVEATPSARQEDVERIKRLLYDHDPRTQRDGDVRTLSVSGRDLNIALRSLIPLPDRQRARISLQDHLATLHYTLDVPDSFLGAYLNLSVAVRESRGELEPDRLTAGSLALPGWFVAPLAAAAEHILARHYPEYGGLREVLQAISLRDDRIEVVYRWDAALMQQVETRGRELLMPDADRQRALAYYRELAAVSRRAGRQASLSTLLGGLFELAGTRSADGDAAAEHRALLLVVGTVLNRSSLHRLVGGDPADLDPGHYYVRWTLAGRNDLAQHFAVSAAIAAAGGSVLADAIGAYKELDDSRGGSGFSFADLLADRAGVEFAVAATGPSAGSLQRAMAKRELQESLFMPRLDELPEGLMEMEFRHRYSDLDDARYAHVKRELETRIAMLPLYRGSGPGQ
jgi:uncharacterized protein YfiM (DUF2279 family)